MIVVDKQGNEEMIVVYDLLYRAYGIKAREVIEKLISSVVVDHDISNINKPVMNVIKKEVPSEEILADPNVE